MMKKLSIASVVGLQLFIQDAFAHGLEEGHHMGPWMMGWGIFPILVIAAIAIITIPACPMKRPAVLEIGVYF